MLRAIFYKEWLKTRWYYLVAVLLSLSFVGYVLLNFFRAAGLKGIAHLWEVMLLRDAVFVDLLQFVPLVVGLLFAVVQFVPDEQVEPILLGTSYFLEPVGRSSKAYVLLRRTLEDTERTAIVTFTLRTKTRLGVLRVHGDLLALQTLRWPKDLKQVDFGPKKSKISSKELAMSASLVEQFSADFDPEQFTDEYQAQLRELLEAKLEQGESVDTEATFGKASEGDAEEGGKVISLMDALERSVRKRRGEQEEATQKPSPEKSGTKKSGSKKSGTKKSGSKKSGTKKSGSTTSGTKKSGSKKSGTKKSGTKKSGTKKTKKSA